eukprot:TRINITY_DN66326_c7_g2_i1.p1 TRINITY_DN66326_c7_g2~~TRINITY_DN66326_c7_g2_i1.p1  ORF type:complete len:625 (-),score=350.43 TRINITY_DN66326_c7_g2_i1:1347-3152(-)
MKTPKIGSAPGGLSMGDVALCANTEQCVAPASASFSLHRATFCSDECRRVCQSSCDSDVDDGQRQAPASRSLLPMSFLGERRSKAADVGAAIRVLLPVAEDLADVMVSVVQLPEPGVVERQACITDYFVHEQKQQQKQQQQQKNKAKKNKNQQQQQQQKEKQQRSQEQQEAPRTEFDDEFVLIDHSDATPEFEPTPVPMSTTAAMAPISLNNIKKTSIRVTYNSTRGTGRGENDSTEGGRQLLRDVLVLHLLAKYGALAIDTVIALWFSARLTRPQGKFVHRVLAELLQMDRQLGGSTADDDDDDDDDVLINTSFVSARVPRQVARAFLDSSRWTSPAVSSDPSEVVLPHGHDMSAVNTVNPLLIRESLEGCAARLNVTRQEQQERQQDWSAHGVAADDTMGQAFFAARALLKAFVTRISTDVALQVEVFNMPSVHKLGLFLRKRRDTYDVIDTAFWQQARSAASTQNNGLQDVLEVFTPLLPHPAPWATIVVSFTPSTDSWRDYLRQYDFGKLLTKFDMSLRKLNVVVAPRTGSSLGDGHDDGHGKEREHHMELVRCGSGGSGSGSSGVGGEVHVAVSSSPPTSKHHKRKKRRGKRRNHH